MNKDNGLQSFSTSYQTAQGGTQIFIGKTNSRIPWDTRLNSGLASGVVGIIRQVVGVRQLAVWTDPDYEAGDRRYLPAYDAALVATAPWSHVRGGSPANVDPIDPTGNTKDYSNIFNGAVYLPGGTKYRYRACKSRKRLTASPTGFDADFTISRDGIQSVLLVKDDGNFI